MAESPARSAGNQRAPHLANRTARPVDHKVANRVVGITAAGLCEPKAVRRAMTWVGNRVTLAVFSARNSTMASLAVPRWGLRRSSSCMARRPKGVAALDKPRTLAAMFISIAPMAGWSGGTSGNRRCTSGRSRRAKPAIRPPASATFMMPRNSAMVPISPRPRVTAASAACSAAPPRASIGGTPGPGGRKACRQPATAKAEAMMAKKTRFTRTLPPGGDRPYDTTQAARRCCKKSAMPLSSTLMCSLIQVTANSRSCGPASGSFDSTFAFSGSNATQKASCRARCAARLG